MIYLNRKVAFGVATDVALDDGRTMRMVPSLPALVRLAPADYDKTTAQQRQRAVILAATRLSTVKRVDTTSASEENTMAKDKAPDNVIHVNISGGRLNPPKWDGTTAAIGTRRVDHNHIEWKRVAQGTGLYGTCWLPVSDAVLAAHEAAGGKPAEGGSSRRQRPAVPPIELTAEQEAAIAPPSTRPPDGSGRPAAVEPGDSAPELAAAGTAAQGGAAGKPNGRSPKAAPAAQDGSTPAAAPAAPAEPAPAVQGAPAAATAKPSGSGKAAKPAAEPKPAKEAAAKHETCELCGYKFPEPRAVARCKSERACKKRREAAAAPAATPAPAGGEKVKTKR